MRYRIGTRGSRLALAQSEQVKTLLHNAFPKDEFTLHIIQTTGDKNQLQALYHMQDKGVFVKEIEQALLAHDIDLAVHSLKDMPVQTYRGLCLAKTLLREDVRDVFVSAKYASLQALPHHAMIGTSSLRRRALLHDWRNDLQIVNIRGNIDTRLRKMKEQGLDGIIIAAAGMHRLHIEGYTWEYLDPDIFVPACGQGALAIEMREEDVALRHKLTTLYKPNMHNEVMMERAFLAAMHGGCHMPIGAYCKIQGKQMHFVCMAKTNIDSSCKRYVYDGNYDPAQAIIAAEQLKKAIL